MKWGAKGSWFFWVSMVGLCCVGWAVPVQQQKGESQLQAQKRLSEMADTLKAEPWRYDYSMGRQIDTLKRLIDNNRRQAFEQLLKGLLFYSEGDYVVAGQALHSVEQSFEVRNFVDGHLIGGLEGLINDCDRMSATMDSESTESDTQIVCSQCKGLGFTVCPRCRGTGVVKDRYVDRQTRQVVESQHVCPECGGFGVHRCDLCGGCGVVNRSFVETKDHKRVNLVRLLILRVIYYQMTGIDLP